MSTRVPEPLALAEFARQVRRALEDLPPAGLDDLLEDLEDHLAEVAADNDGSLAVLGSPTSYARELRRAAGLPARAGPGLSARSARARVALARLSRHDTVRPVLAFLPELRPAWWVLRAWLALLALDYLFGFRSFAFPLPSALGLGAVLGLPLMAAAIVLSVRLGQRTAREAHPDPRRRMLTLGGNALLALLAVVALVAVQDRSSQPVYADGSYGPAYGHGGGMAHSDGTPISNIYPYSSSGQPLTGILLYDQDGRALNNLSETTPVGLQVERLLPAGTAPPPANAYPQQQQVLGYDGMPLTPQPQTTPTSPPTASSPPSPTDLPAPPGPGDPASPGPTSPDQATPAPGAAPPASPLPTSAATIVPTP